MKEIKITRKQYESYYNPKSAEAKSLKGIVPDQYLDTKK